MSGAPPTPAPIYVVGVIPGYALHDYIGQDYAAWYLGHTDWNQLDPAVVVALFRQLGAPALVDFFSQLERDYDYTVFYSHHVGFITLPPQSDEVDTG